MANKTAFTNNQASWSGIVLIVVVVMLIGIYFLRINSSYDLVPYTMDVNLVVYKSNVARAAEDVEKMTEYLNTDRNFKTKYLDNWTLKTEVTGDGENEIFAITFSNVDKLVSISVMSETMEGIVKNSINIDKETNIDINGEVAMRIDGGSSKDGADISMVLLKKDSKLYVLQGVGQEFDDIVSYFEII